MSRYILTIGGSDIDTFYKTDAFPAAGDVAYVKPLGDKVGGCVSNVSVVASAYGADVRVLDYLRKDDLSSDVIVSNLRHYGVDVSHIRYGEDVINGHCLIMNRGDEKCIFVIDPEHPFYETDRELTELLNNAAYIYTLMHVVNRSFEDLSILQEARRNGARIIFDGSSQYTGEMEVRLLKALADGLFINRQSYERLCQVLGADAVEYLINNGCEFVCVTNGSRQTELHTATGTYYQDSFKVNVIDSTGAGDTFAGCFLAHKLKGYDWSVCLEKAALAGAYACTGEGGTFGAIDSDTLQRFHNSLITREKMR